MKRFILGSILGFLVLVGSMTWYWPDGRVHLVACDVGQGDGILIWRGFAQVVVDGGPNDKIIACLSKFMPFWDRTIELVILTHPEADHLNGLRAVVKRYRVGQIVTSELGQDKFTGHVAATGEEIKLNQLIFRVVAAQKTAAEVNDTSLVLELSYGDFDALLTGDISSETESLLINSGADLASEVLKVAHHGSKYSSSAEFLGAVRPAVALISAGKNNRYGHPTSETLDRLQAVGARILRTDQDGDIEIVSDGERLWLK